MCTHRVHSEPVEDAGLRIRVQRDLREKFPEVYRVQDKLTEEIIEDL